MNRAEKYHQQKESGKSFDQRTHEARVKKLHMLLFPEEQDFMSDDVAAAKKRSMGENPMSQEYQVMIEGKRKVLGVSPLASNGNSADESSKEFCERIVTALEAVRF